MSSGPGPPRTPVSSPSRALSSAVVSSLKSFPSEAEAAAWLEERPRFIEVHRLVAAFFNVIGISEHARVIARTD